MSNYAKGRFKIRNRCWSSKFAKKIDLANLKSDIDKFDIGNLKNVRTNLSNSKSKVDILDVDKLVLSPVDLSKLSDIVKKNVVKKDVLMLRSKLLKMKYLILLT